ncbi:unknown protein [Seminavis robusta]|uniref:Uncharacterized protein n=1 Tax=Seminavis robusta TaxID=568900 RepID=A0A9N8HBF5_9STRA|nr:unknown protein [Seminavis robusta]|eukprot:Sro259_g101310.1 n/a (878) ;mRNA; f:27571-30204
MNNPTGSQATEKQVRGLRRQAKATSTTRNHVNVATMAPLMKGGLRRGHQGTTVGAHFVTPDSHNNSRTEILEHPTGTMNNPTATPSMEKQVKGLRRQVNATSATINHANVGTMVPLVKGGLRRGPKGSHVGAQSVTPDSSNNSPTETLEYPTGMVETRAEVQQEADQQGTQEDGNTVIEVAQPKTPKPNATDPIEGYDPVTAYTVDEHGRNLEVLPEVVIAAPLKKSRFWRGLAILAVLLAILVVGVVLIITFTRNNDNESGQLGTAFFPMISASPTGYPSMVPTSEPSLAPTSSPLPSMVPSTAPTGLPTGDFCYFGINMTCEELYSGEPCETFYPDVRLADENCASDPIEMVTIYTGFDCITANNITRSSLPLSCKDFNGGPTQHEFAYLIVTPIRNNSIVYFEGPVHYFGKSTLRNPLLEPISETLNFSLYSLNNDHSNTGILLQEVILEFSCPTSSFDDSYGATQFNAMRSIEQGYVSTVHSTNLGFEFNFRLHVANEGVSSAIITSLSQATNFDPFFFNFTDLVASSDAKGLLHPGDELVLDSIVSVGLDDERHYGFLTDIAGISEGNTACRQGSHLQVTFGRRIPSILETEGPSSTPAEAPTGVPSILDQTTAPDNVNSGNSMPVPNEVIHTSCDIIVTIECVGRTLHGAEECSRLLACPHPFPSVLGMTYTGQNCGDAEECTDFFHGVAGVDQALVIIKVQDSPVLEQNLRKGEHFTLRSDFGLGPSIEILVLDTNRTRRLQWQQLGTCLTDDALVGTPHGAVTIKAIAPSIARRPLASIQLQVRIQNSGNTIANLTMATASTPSGNRNLLPDPFVLVAPGGDTVLPLSSDRVDDWITKHPNRNLMMWSAVVSGVTEGGQPCQASDSLQF